MIVSQSEISLRIRFLACRRLIYTGRVSKFCDKKFLTIDSLESFETKILIMEISRLRDSFRTGSDPPKPRPTGQSWLFARSDIREMYSGVGARWTNLFWRYSNCHTNMQWETIWMSSRGSFFHIALLLLRILSYLYARKLAPSLMSSLKAFSFKNYIL